MTHVRLMISVEPTQNGGLRAIFGGTGLDADAIPAVVRVVAAEIISAIAVSSRADDPRDDGKPGTQRCPA